MFEVDGKQLTLQEVQAAADQNQLSLDEYKQKFNVTEVGDPPTKQNNIHISREDFEQYEGDKVEEDLVKKLNLKYSKSPYKFSQARGGRDAIRVKTANGSNRVFKLPSQYNQQRDGAYGQYDSYDDFVNFLNENIGNESQQSVFNKTGLTPDDYAFVDTEETFEVSAGYDPMDRKLGINQFTRNVKRKVTDEEQANLVNTTEKYLRKYIQNPGEFGIIKNPHSYDTQAMFTSEQETEIHKQIYQKVIDDTGLNISYDHFLSMTGKSYGGGMFNAMKADLGQEEKYANYIRAQFNNQDINVFNDKSFQAFENKMFEHFGPKWQAKSNLIGLINKNVKAIDELKESIELGSTDASAANQKIIQLEAEIKGYESDIKKLGEVKRVVNVGGDPMDRKLGINQVTRTFTDEDLVSMYIENGYTQTSAEQIAKMKTGTQNTAPSMISTIMAAEPSLNDYEAHEKYYTGLHKRYIDLQAEAVDKEIKLDFSKKLPAMQTNSSIRNTINKLQDLGYIDENGKGTATYAQLHKNGLTSRHFDGFFDIFKGVIKEDDVNWMRIHDEALNDNEGARRAMFELYRLNRDPGKIKKPGNIATFLTTGAKAILKDFGGLSEAEADEKVAGISGKANTTRYMLDQLNELAMDYNKQFSASIALGEVKPLEFSQEQAEVLARTFSEEVAEGVGNFVPVLIKFGMINTGLGAIGVTRYIASGLNKAKKSGDIFNKIMYHAGGAILEEGKMAAAFGDYYKPTGGATFYSLGQLTSGDIFKTRFRYLNSFTNKVLKAGPVGAASMEFAQVAELAYDDLMDNRDFRTEFNSLYKDFDEPSRRLLVNSFVFGLIGAQHLKKTDFMSTGAKYKVMMEVAQKQQDLLGFTQTKGVEGETKGAKRKTYEDLSPKDKKKYDAYGKQIELLDQMIQVETQAWNLDTENPNFEGNFKKRYTDRINSSLKAIIGENYKPVKVEFVDGKLDSGNVAEYRPSDKKVIISRETYQAESKGKEIHELIGHHALRAIFDNQPGLKMKFNTKMSELFKAQDNMLGAAVTGFDVKLSEAIQKFYKGENKDIKAEEFLAYMLEAFSKPEVYYTQVGRTMALDIKSELQSIFQEAGLYVPKIKNAKDFIGYIARLSRDASRGNNITEQLRTYANLSDIDFLNMELVQARVNNAKKKFGSKDFVNKNKEISDKLFKAREEKNEQLVSRYEGELFAQNLPMIQEYINTTYRRELGSTRDMFESSTYEEVAKLLKTYKPEKGEFGAYLREALFGGGQFGGGRTGNILKGMDKGAVKNTTSIDADGNFLQIEGGISSGGPVGRAKIAETGGIILRNKLDIKPETEQKILEKVDLKNIDKLNYRDLQDLTPDLTMEMFGGRADVKAGESSKNIKNKVQYIADKWQTLYDLLPQGAMLKTGSQNIEGLSTNIKDPLLNGLLYTAGQRVSAAETGKTAGLPVQGKIKGLDQAAFLEKFGIFIGPDGKVDFTKTKIKAQSANLRAIDALIAETGRSITNQTVRAYLEKNYEKNPRLASDLSKGALLDQIAGGKSESLASKNFYDLMKEKGYNETQTAQLINQYRNNRLGMLTSNAEAHDLIKDYVETTARVYAEQGKSAEQFMTAIKNSKWNELLGKDAIHLLSDAKFKNDPVAQRKFEKQAFDLSKFVPILQQGGNQKMILDLFAGHYNIVGSANAKVDSNFKNTLNKNLSKTFEGKNLSPELIERWNNIDWASIKSSYASSNYTGYKNIMKAGTLAEQQAIARETFSTKEGKAQLELYDVWNSTLQEWLFHKSPPGSKKFNEKAAYILKIKKANGAIGTTGERTLAPPGYAYLPGKAFAGTVKFEHLKSSSQQSLESALLILDGSYTRRKAGLKQYRGIYGMLGDFNMVDTATGKVNNSDIFRFAKNLELSKHIYSVESGFKKSLYQEIVDKVGSAEVKKLQDIQKNATFDKAVEMARRPNAPRKGISVFDFDQTLANTKEKIKVVMPDGTTTRIDAAEFARSAESLEAKGAKFDFTEFNDVVNADKGPLADLALKRQEKFGSGDIFILTARPQGSALAIQKFMKGIGVDIPIENITGLESGLPQAKADWVIGKAAEGYNDFYFADDAIKNVEAVKRALTQLDVKSDVQQALGSRDLNLDFNKILENATGIGAEKIYSKAKGQVQGASKGRFKFWIPPSAEDFVGLIYPTLGKGKKGDQQMAWYKKNLLDPFARAENAITNERHQRMKDFHALKKEISDVPKDIRKTFKDGPLKGYNNETAIRTYIWNKQGMEVPGMSKTDMMNLVNHVKSNENLRTFGDRLIMINKGDGYVKPGNNWNAGTITTDLLEGLNTTTRAKHLKEWQTNADIIFSPENLNKYEAAYGATARSALENILSRMKTGSNRKPLGGMFQKLENEVLDWTNNSVGAIMFLNSRSAVLQTISAVNYMNFRDNNPLAAAKAFANQPQYWKDFNTLFNSDYLVQRRDGLKININEAEIAEMAATSKNKAKAAISYLLNKGFLLTRHADSFAIASGGASFYRNRINKYIKEGMSKKKAEEQAFIDFREISEESQQSSRTDRISAQQASGLGRVVLAFANTPMQYARLQKRAIQDLINGRGDAKTNLSKVTYYGFVQNLLFNTIQQAAFAIGFDEDPDDQKQLMDKSGNILNGMLDSQLRGLGYGGAAVSTVKNVLFELSEQHAKGNPKYEEAAWEFLDFSPPISSKVTKIRSALRSIDYNLDDMKSQGFHIDNPAYMAGGQVLSAVGNIPMDRVLRKIQNVRDASDEDIEMWAKVALLSGWSKWELGLEDNKDWTWGDGASFEDIKFDEIDFDGDDINFE